MDKIKGTKNWAYFFGSTKLGLESFCCRRKKKIEYIKSVFLKHSKVHLAFKLKIETVLFGGNFVSPAHLIFDYQTSVFLQAKQPVGMIKWHHHLTVDVGANGLSIKKVNHKVAQGRTVFKGNNLNEIRAWGCNNDHKFNPANCDAK